MYIQKRDLFSKYSIKYLQTYVETIFTNISTFVETSSSVSIDSVCTEVNGNAVHLSFGLSTTFGRFGLIFFGLTSVQTESFETEEDV